MLARHTRSGKRFRAFFVCVRNELDHRAVRRTHLDARNAVKQRDVVQAAVGADF